ncbi:MAG: hypothetical protein EB059_08425 [Alphaproteobacteria bacterium]|nr:hypothetical protein [Alphaproteobacteria bacterium]
MKPVYNLVLFLALIFCLSAPLHAAEPDPVHIAVAGPITGPLAAFGEQIKRGVELSADAINANGGINGKKLAIAVYDDSCETKQAVLVANKIVASGTKIVIGHWCSASSIAAQKIYRDEGILHIDVGGLLSEFTTEGGPLTFRMSTTEKAFAERLSTFLVNKKNAKSVAMFYHQALVTAALAKYMKINLDALKTSYPIDESYMPGQRDFSAATSKLNDKKPDALLCGGYTLECSLLVRQTIDAGYKGTIIGWDTFNSPDFYAAIGANNTRNIYSVDYARPVHLPAFQKLNDVLKSKGYPNEITTFLSYATVEILAKSFAAGTKVENVATEMKKNTFDTVIGPVQFDTHGDRANAALSVYQWENGTLKVIE